VIIYKFFKNLFLNLKYTKILKKIYKEEKLLEGFSKIFGTEFHLDWVGRAYAVLNPNLDENGNYSPNTQIFEYGENGLNNDKMIEQWVMEKMIVISNFIKVNNLFELLTYSIEKLDEYDNYLFVLEPITLADCIKWSKWMAGLIGVLAIIGTILAIIL